MLPQVFSILSGLIEERAGLHYDDRNMELLRDKVSLRARDAGFDSLLDYYYFLRYDPGGPAEIDALIEALVVHETYFFREALQLRVLVKNLLAPALASGRQVRVWCAAAATGEEPLTLAMMLDEAGALGRVRILASDVSERALAVARRGEFGPRSARALPPEVVGRWLERRGDRIVAPRRLLEAIEWRRINLVDGVSAQEGAFDAIVCRNVLIYFRDETVLRVVASVVQRLRPGGLLLVGASESLLRYGTSLSCEEHGGAFFYRRVA
ncbi:MAG: protein-glutamate O-methyltransferase CheR [Myxococcales bacterium]